jgi:methionine--tRNA ligase beta chain
LQKTSIKVHNVLLISKYHIAFEEKMITFDDFKKIDLRIGKILSAEKVEGTDKLMKIEIDLGKEKRQLVAGIADMYDPNSLIGKEIPVLMNLEPRKIRGIESQGMILAVDVGGKPVIMHPDREVPPGSTIR